VAQSSTASSADTDVSARQWIANWKERQSPETSSADTDVSARQWIDNWKERQSPEMPDQQSSEMPEPQSAKQWIANWKEQRSSEMSDPQSPMMLRPRSEEWMAAYNDAVTVDKSKMNIYGEPLESCVSFSPSGPTEDSFIQFTGEKPKICIDVVVTPTPTKGWAGEEQAQKDRKTFLKKTTSMSLFAFFESGWRRRQLIGSGTPMPKCGAIPVDVFQSQYTSELLSNCENKVRQYKVEGPLGFPLGLTEQVVEAPPKSSGSPINPDKMSRKCRKFRAALELICDACGSEAPSDGAEKELRAQCGVLAEATDLISPSFPDVSSITSYVGLVSLFMGIFAFGVARIRYRVATVSVEPLL
jgi:hypothetical protein